MTPAGTSNELDVQNEWEENTNTLVASIIQYYTVLYSNIVKVKVSLKLQILLLYVCSRDLCGTHGGHEAAEVRRVRRIIYSWGRGLRGGWVGKIVDVVLFSGRPQSFRYQRRPVDDCSPGPGGMA